MLLVTYACEWHIQSFLCVQQLYLVSNWQTSDSHDCISIIRLLFAVFFFLLVPLLLYIYFFSLFNYIEIFLYDWNGMSMGYTETFSFTTTNPRYLPSTLMWLLYIFIFCFNVYIEKRSKTAAQRLTFSWIISLFSSISRRLVNEANFF